MHPLSSLSGRGQWGEENSKAAALSPKVGSPHYLK